MLISETVIKRNDAYECVLRASSIMTPPTLKHLQMVRREFSSEGKVLRESTYEFFLENSEIKTLANALQCLSE